MKSERNNQDRKSEKGIFWFIMKQEAGNSRLDETVSTLKEISGKVDGQNDRLFLIQERQAGFAERIAALEEWRRRSGG